MPGMPTGTVTFLFTDIEGSTQLWQQHPEAMHPALARHDELIRTAIQAYDGHVFKTMGDAFYAAFHTAPEALQAALAAQQALTAEPWPDGMAIKVRMALHTGAAEVRDSDYFGQPLNRVARLLAAGHGGQLLISAASQELIRDLLPPSVSLLPLGEHRLRDLNRPETIFQLQHPDLPAAFPPLKSLEGFRTNLPQQLTSFIGREKELAAIKKLLEKTHLLTLTGSGGCGKTRLSLHVAADLLEHYPDGAWLVELAALSDASLVPQEVASALGLTEQPGKTFVQTLTDFVKPKRLLLVLDNCEHLLNACAQLCNSLLRACPHLTILASSREALGIAGEQTYRIPSLSLPDPRQVLSVEQLSHYEAVRLFIERATSSKADFAVTNQSAPSVAAVCHRLDGIPLAIELAAARVRSLTVEEIDNRLDKRFRLLTGGSKTALPRQQTLRALIDWSYDLLTEQERLLLCRLSVFAGGWTLQPVERVCAGETEAGAAIEDWEVLDLLTGLVDKSLVVVETQETPTRYRLLETVRQYALERLEQYGEAEAVRVRHRDYFLALAEEAEPQLSGAAQGEWLERLEGEHDNLRQAMAFCLEEAEGAEAGLRLGASLWRFWYMRGHWTEAQVFLTAALKRPVASQSRDVRAKALSGAGILATMQADYDIARARHEESLAIRRELGDRRGIASSLNQLGNVASDQSDFVEARVLFQESLRLFRELEIKGGIAATLSNLGHLAVNQGDYGEAHVLSEEALTIYREVGNKEGIASALNTLGHVALYQGDYGVAQSRYEEGLTLRRALGNKWGIANSLGHLGALALVQDDYAGTRALLEAGLTLYREVGDKGGCAESIDAFARLAHGEQYHPRSARLWGAATALREQIGLLRSPAEQAAYSQQTEQARVALGEAAFTAAFAEGRAMTLEQAIAYALSEHEPEM